VTRPATRAGFCVVAALAGCATGSGAGSGTDRRHEVTIAPYERHDRCVDLAAGDRLDYRWEATVPVAFDLRYRSGGGIVEPVAQPAQPEGSGVYTAVIPARYCATWEAGAIGVELGYWIRVSRRPD
jgi:hypothetical protein